MVQGCGNKCVKYSVLVVNLLVCIAGAAVLAVSLALALSSKFQDDFADIFKDTGLSSGTLTSMKLVFYITAGIGGLIFLTGFLGCCGAGCENTCLLGLFFVIILILFLAELAIGIAALVLQGQNKLEGDVNKYYTDTVIQNNYLKNCNNPQDGLTIAWNKVQSDNNCCGCNNIQDYNGAACLKQYQSQGVCTPQTADNGCCSILWDDLQKNLVAVGGVSIGLLVIELFAMIFSCCLCSAIRKKRSSNQYS
jgi:hypothetical protein